MTTTKNTIIQRMTPITTPAIIPTEEPPPLSLPIPALVLTTIVVSLVDTIEVVGVTVVSLVDIIEVVGVTVVASLVDAIEVVGVTVVVSLVDTIEVVGVTVVVSLVGTIKIVNTTGCNIRSYCLKLIHKYYTQLVAMHACHQKVYVGTTCSYT